MAAAATATSAGAATTAEVQTYQPSSTRLQAKIFIANEATSCEASGTSDDSKSFDKSDSTRLN